MIYKSTWLWGYLLILLVLNSTSLFHQKMFIPCSCHFLCMLPSFSYPARFGFQILLRSQLHIEMILVWLLRKLEFAEEARPMDNREILAVPLISTEKNLFCHHYHLAIGVNIVFVVIYFKYRVLSLLLPFNWVARETQSYSWRSFHSGIKYKTIKTLLYTVSSLAHH